MIKEWLLDSPERLKLVAVGLAVASVVLLVTMALSRSGGVPQPQPLPSETPETVSTALLPPSPAVEEASPTPEYGSSAPIALEAVQAFLTGDRPKFARLGQQEAVETVNEAAVPPPGQRITGNPKTLLGGPTRQQISVPTTDGDLVLDMVIVDGAWKVMSIEYAR
jgi:hypothetical protein